MENVLLMSAETTRLLLSYGFYGAIILFGLVCIIVLRRKTKKELRPEWVKNRVQRAKKYGQDLLIAGAKKGLKTLLGTTHLLKLKDRVADASWAAYQLVTEKKDIVFDGIANTLDKAATTLVKETEDGFVAAETYEKDLQKTVEILDGVLVKINAIIASR